MKSGMIKEDVFIVCKKTMQSAGVMAVPVYGVV